MKQVVFLVLLFVAMYPLLAQQVPDSVMQRVYEEVKTPYKKGMVITSSDNSKKIDCPSIFRKGNRWCMTYIQFDGRGYETWLATSKDLLHWETKGKLLSFSDTADWDMHQKAGYIALQDPTWGGSYKLNKYKGNYWMSYFGSNMQGYEAGELGISLAYTKKNPAIAHEWNRLSHPVLRASDSNVRWWENKKLYKSSIIEDSKKQLGYRFLMYYNANGDTSGNVPKLRWFERIGVAGSNDMLHWDRFINDPLLQHSRGITADPIVQRWNNLWIMFYYGAFWEGREKETFNRFACSYDGIHWTDWKGPDLIRSSESYDAKYAHKSYVVKYKGVVYHFYCAVDKNDNRGIAVATSKE
jgi:predicted GH43/DUF377 family glycosyl hydrolase